MVRPQMIPPRKRQDAIKQAKRQDSSTNPNGIVNNPGGQWPEARGLMRVYSGNPFAQSRLLETLVGLYKIPFEGIRPNPDIIMDKDGFEISRLCIAGAIKYISEQFPEWREDKCTVDNELGEEGTYHADPLLLDQVDEVLGHERDAMMILEDSKTSLF